MKDKNLYWAVVAIIVICLLGIGCIGIANRARQPAMPVVMPVATQPPETSEPTDEELAAYLAELEAETFVMSAEHHATYQQELSSGETFNLIETFTTKYTATPTLITITTQPPTYTTDKHSSEIDELLALVQGQVGSASTVYTQRDLNAQTETTYLMNDGQWSKYESPYYDRTAAAYHVYHELWYTAEQPELIDASTMQASDDFGEGLYTFHFDPRTKKLVSVDYQEEDSGNSVTYTILNEAPIATIPDEVVNSAVEASFDDLLGETVVEMADVSTTTTVPVADSLTETPETQAE